jgi:hypothetical protein
MMMRQYVLVLSFITATGCSEDPPQDSSATQSQTESPANPVEPVPTTDAAPENPLDDPSVAALAAELVRMQASVSKETGGRFLWDKQERPYAVIDFTQKNYVPGGVQHRTVRAVLPAPKSKPDVEAAAKEIYDQLKADIEATQPDATYKRINMLIYDSFADAKAFDGSQIIHISTTAGPNVPTWEKASVRWQWRDPAHRPTAAELAVFHDYWSTLDDCRKVAEAPYHDKDGFFTGKVKDQPDIDRRYAIEKRKLVNKLLALHGIAIPEFANQIATVWLWRQGITPTEKAVSESAQSYLEEWAPEKGT